MEELRAYLNDPGKNLRYCPNLGLLSAREIYTFAGIGWADWMVPPPAGSKAEVRAAIGICKRAGYKVTKLPQKINPLLIK